MLSEINCSVFLFAIQQDFLLLLTSAQSCQTLCNPMDYSLPGSSVHGIFPDKNTGVVAISFSRGSFQCRVRSQVSCVCISRQIFYHQRHLGNPPGPLTRTNSLVIGEFSIVTLDGSVIINARPSVLHNRQITVT